MALVDHRGLEEGAQRTRDASSGSQARLAPLAKRSDSSIRLRED